MKYIVFAHQDSDVENDEGVIANIPMFDSINKASAYADKHFASKNIRSWVLPISADYNMFGESSAFDYLVTNQVKLRQPTMTLMDGNKVTKDKIYMVVDNYLQLGIIDDDGEYCIIDSMHCEPVVPIVIE